MHCRMLSEKWSEKWSEKQTKILELISKNPKITRRELMGELDINQSAVQRHMDKLKAAGILERVGPDRGGYWKLNK